MPLLLVHGAAPNKAAAAGLPTPAEADVEVAAVTGGAPLCAALVVDLLV
jgi:hypothetical protein